MNSINLLEEYNNQATVNNNTQINNCSNITFSHIDRYVKDLDGSFFHQDISSSNSDNSGGGSGGGGNGDGDCCGIIFCGGGLLLLLLFPAFFCDCASGIFSGILDCFCDSCCS